ncbi:LacI family transcriptional regulator [Specibacter cremeus]|uniref:LacI family transcriptional regulator n=1 Tax=Specibacter cremeus TaxID=1629051 RepID=UPI0013DE7492
MEGAAGFAAALQDAGITDGERFVRADSHDATAARDAVLDLVSGPLPPTALVTTNNRITIGALQALVGFDDFDLADVLGATLVAHDPDRMGARHPDRAGPAGRRRRRPAVRGDPDASHRTGVQQAAADAVRTGPRQRAAASATSLSTPPISASANLPSVGSHPRAPLVRIAAWPNAIVKVRQPTVATLAQVPGLCSREGSRHRSALRRWLQGDPAPRKQRSNCPDTPVEHPFPTPRVDKRALDPTVPTRPVAIPTERHHDRWPFPR